MSLVMQCTILSMYQTLLTPMQQQCPQLQHLIKVIPSTLFVSIMQRSSHHLQYAGLSQGQNDMYKLCWRQECRLAYKANTSWQECMAHVNEVIWPTAFNAWSFTFAQHLRLRRAKCCSSTSSRKPLLDTCKNITANPLFVSCLTLVQP